MSGGTIQEDLRSFTTQLIERCGGMVEWSADGQGTAILPPELGRFFPRQGDEPCGDEVRLTERPGDPGLCVSLATDFLDAVGAVLDAAVPRVGAFHLEDRYLKRGDLQEAVSRAYTWLNARVRVRDAQPTTVEYQTWSCLVSLRSDDYWESRLAMTLNSASSAEVDLPDPLECPDLQPQSAPETAPCDTWARAQAQARLYLQGAAKNPQGQPHLAAVGLRGSNVAADSPVRRGAAAEFQRSAAAFLARMDGRLARDRKRLEDYYGALLRETRHPGRRRSAPSPDPAQLESKARAVQLELRRKLAELHERYTIRARVRPIALVRATVPALAVSLAVQRKGAVRTHTIYWNSLLKQFEPMLCSLCGRSVFSLAFRDDDVAPLCGGCQHNHAAGARR